MMKDFEDKQPASLSFGEWLILPIVVLFSLQAFYGWISSAVRWVLSFS